MNSEVKNKQGKVIKLPLNNLGMVWKYMGKGGLKCKQATRFCFASEADKEAVFEIKTEEADELHGLHYWLEVEASIVNDKAQPETGWVDDFIATLPEPPEPKHSTETMFCVNCGALTEPEPENNGWVRTSEKSPSTQIFSADLVWGFNRGDDHARYINIEDIEDYDWYKIIEHKDPGLPPKEIPRELTQEEKDRDFISHSEFKFLNDKVAVVDLVKAAIRYGREGK